MFWRALALLSAIFVLTVQPDAFAQDASAGAQSAFPLKLLGDGETAGSVAIDWWQAAVAVGLALTGFMLLRSAYLRFLRHL